MPLAMTPDQLNALSEDDLKMLVRSYARQRLYAQQHLDQLVGELKRRQKLHKNWLKRQRVEEPAA